MQAIVDDDPKNIPTSNTDALRIIALVKEKSRVVSCQLSDNRIVSKEDCVTLAKTGNIRGVCIATRKDFLYLKSLPDDKENNNLINLPFISR